MSQELQKFDPAQAPLLAVILDAAKRPEIDVEKMERLLAMHERVTAKEAEKSFNDAMSACQKEMPKIITDRANNSTNSRYAQLETVNKMIVPIYTAHGFSLSFGTADSHLADHYRVTCKIAHKDGHSESRQADVPLDNTGMKGTQNKTKTHGFGSTMTYGRRYLTMLIFNLSVGDKDDDGNQGRKAQPEGPSTKLPDDIKALKAELWTTLAPVRGETADWNAAHQWLWRNEILDGAKDQRVNSLSAEQLKTVIHKAKELITSQ